MKKIAFVSERATAYPLEVALGLRPEWGITASHYGTIGEFVASGEVPDAAFLTDITSDETRSLLNCLTSMILERVPVAVIAFHAETPDIVTQAWGRIEEFTRERNNASIAAMEERGEYVDESLRVAPADAVPVAIIPSARGIAGILAEFGESLGIPATDIASLPDIARQPLPEPMTGAGSALKFNEHKGRMYAVTSDKGGCGKTTLSILFGAALAYHSFAQGAPLSVIVVDLDRQSQMRSHFRGISQNIGVPMLKDNSDKHDIEAALAQFTTSGGQPFEGLYALLGGDNRSEHLALRESGIYQHVIPMLRAMFDVVILDCSVGTASDPMTSWAQQNSDVTYYVLDQSRESLDMAVSARESALSPSENGGLGIDPAAWRVIVNRKRHTDSSEHGHLWASHMFEHFTSQGTTVEATVPESHPEVSDAKDDQALVELVQTSDVLANHLQHLAHVAYPSVIPKTGEKHKKRGLFSR